MTNPFEAGARKLIPATLVYVRCGEEILMLHRNAPDRPNDFHAGKWNGLGGKLELDESPLAGALREIREESGLELEPGALRIVGVLQFPNFKPGKAEDWLAWVCVAEVPSEVRSRRLEGTEGSLHWIHRSKLLELNLWPGDREFLPHVLSERPFFGTIWYDSQGAVARSEFSAAP